MSSIHHSLKKKKGKSAAIFSLKYKVIGKTKSVREATTMKDPKTKDTLTNRNEIKQASLNYCVELNYLPTGALKKDMKKKPE